MKKLIFTLCLTPFFAYASSPNVGDTAVLVGNISQGNQHASLNVKSQLTQFDSAQNAYLFVQEVLIDGQAQSNPPTWEQKDNLFSSEDTHTIVTECLQIGGTPENVRVPAGAFNTCKLALDDGSGFVWVGEVPFGMVQILQDETQDHAKMNLQLSSYTFGK